MAKTTPPTGNDLGNLKFEAAMAELEKLAQAMEGGTLSLEESLESYRRGMELLKHCQSQLAAAEQKVQILENGALRDFSQNGGDTESR
ncbi:MAG: exodeoxyribonuclease VII small subunit [Betaproteobacteria bacterium]|nr:exodeoxyribonuclease VII small subunit [Betaproteobacteria bacterium]